MIPADLFAITEVLQAGEPAFRNEFGSLQPEDFIDWPDREAYSTGWLVFPLFMANPHESIPPAVLERNRRRCPQSAAILDRPDVHIAGISRLLPGCHIFPHQDHPEPGVLRAHMGIRSHQRALMRIGEEIFEWRDGLVHVFDHGLMHEAANQGTDYRDVLLIDFQTSPAEQRAVAAWRGGG